LSKLSASEFQTWESLYWPDKVPRTSQLPESPLESVIAGLDARWSYKSSAYSVPREAFVGLTDSVALKLTEANAKMASVMASDPIMVLAAVAAAFKTGTSVEVVHDPSKTPPSGAVTIVQGGRSSDPKGDFKVESAQAAGAAWEPSDPAVSILFPEDARAIYPLGELRSAATSFSSFLGLREERGVALLGSIRREFGFFTAFSAMVTGVPLLVLDDVKGLQSSSPKPSVMFLGRDMDGNKEGSLGSFRSVLGGLRREFAYVGVEGPSAPGFTRGLERSTGIPVLQMYGVSGRGIVLSNPKEFNTHGSAGIPITNAEAIIADNYEGNWTRDRILMGPGVDGELVFRGSFVDSMKDVGDPRQNPVRAAILGQSTDWVTTGITAKMDENGYFYVKDASFR